MSDRSNPDAPGRSGSAASNREVARNLAEGITLRHIDYLEAEIERLKRLCHTETAK